MNFVRTLRKAENTEANKMDVLEVNLIAFFLIIGIICCPRDVLRQFSAFFYLPFFLVPIFSPLKSMTPEPTTL